MDTPGRILIVDDEEAARYGIIRVLSGAGYQVSEAADGRAALELIASFKPEVVVSDINMPELDGLSLLRALNATEDPPPVILLTAYGSQERVLEALRAGAYDYIAKPFELDELRLVVRNAWERQRLAAQNRRYRDAIARSERLATLGRLVAGITHEMNTPLGALTSAVDTLDRVVRKLAPQSERPELAAMAESAAVNARKASERIARVVRNLKQFARIDHAETSATPIAQSVSDTLAILDRELDGIAVVRNVDASLLIPGPVSEWNDVLLNLLLNARDAIYEKNAGGGNIGISVERDGRYAVIRVEDNGGGIPPGELAHIFDPGYTTKGVRVGTGLGLPIVWRVVESRGGTLDANSTVGSGSCFTIRVPLAEGS